MLKDIQDRDALFVELYPSMRDVGARVSRGVIEQNRVTLIFRERCSVVSHSNRVGITMAQMYSKRVGTTITAVYRLPQKLAALRCAISVGEELLELRKTIVSGLT